jgi:hypothetical protein
MYYLFKLHGFGGLVMGKYSPLGDFLRAQRRNEVPMTFAQIERLIGGSLPQSHQYRSWWSNNSFNSVMTKVWLDAGFRSSDVDVKHGRLVFRKIAKETSTASDPDTKPELGRPAVSSRDPMYGAMKGLVRIAPGTDLTDPADPEWANAVER